MTLFRQLQIFVIVMMLAVLGIVLHINFSDTKEYIRGQLYTNAKNTANSLSLSMSPFMNDSAVMETMINAIFDGGYYEEITLSNQSGEDVYSKKEDILIEGVPAYFINLVKLDAPVAEAAVSSGWTIYGTLEVKAHTGLAYLRLWETFKHLILWFIILGVFVSVAASFTLKFLLSSLQTIKKQAEAIGNNEFIINENIPKTVELKQVVLAMNSMVHKVQTIYKREVDVLRQYQELQYKDQQTGLYNRKYFIKHLSIFTSSQDERSNGFIILISFSGLEKIHKIAGYLVAQKFYDSISNIMRTEADSKLNAFVSCLNVSDFVVALPSVDTEEVMAFADNIYAQTKILLSSSKDYSDYIDFAIGVAPYNETENIGTILTKADYALSMAKNIPEPHIELFKNNDNSLMFGKTEWKKIIESALVEKRFLLTAQPVISETEELHQEIFVNMVDLEGQVQRAGFFMPMVIKLSLAEEIDKYVLKHATDFLLDNPDITLAVNVSNDFLKDRASFTWFRKFLFDIKELRDRLVFEISDTAVNKYFHICLDFAGLLKGTGFSFGIDRFVMSENSVKHLDLLKPDYIKVEQDYLLDMEDENSKDLALNSFLTITESLGIKLIATKVENDEQKEVLSSRQIKYFQGRGIADISPLGEKK